MKKKLFLTLLIASIFGCTLHAMEQATPKRNRFDALLKLQTQLLNAVAGLKVNQGVVNAVSFSKRNKFKNGEIVIVPHAGGYSTGIIVSAGAQRNTSWVEIKAKAALQLRHEQIGKIST